MCPLKVPRWTQSSCTTEPGPDSLQLHQRQIQLLLKIMADHPGKRRRRISGDKHICCTAALFITKAHTFERKDKLKEMF